MIEDMLHFQITVFLTFVVMTSTTNLQAAPVLQDLNSQSKTESLSEISDPLLESASLSPSPNYQNSIKATFGWIMGDVGQQSSSKEQTAIGLSYSHKLDPLISREYQAHWLTGKMAWFQWSERQLIDINVLYEPYFKYGLSFFADPEDGLSSFTRLDQYFGSASVGMLDIGPWSTGITFEMGLHAGISGLAFHIQTGIQFEF